MPSMLCAQQRTQYIGATTALTDGSGNATLALPAGTSVGDLLIFETNGAAAAPVVGGGGSGSWTSTSGRALYKVAATLSSVTITGASATSWPVLLVVVRGPTSMGAAQTPTPGGSYPAITMAGVTKSAGCLGILWVLGASDTNDGASSYVMTSPLGAIYTGRLSSGNALVAGFVEPYPAGYASGGTASITATGGTGGTSYNLREAYELL